MNAAEKSAPRPSGRSSGRKARVAGAAGLIAAGAVVGGFLVSGAGAMAATSSSSASPSTSSTTPAAGTSQAQSSTPVRTDEKATTDAVAATLKTKALAAVPGGTVYRIETDAGDGVYEAHMTKSDGSLVTVKFDANLNVTGVETGMGQGDPRPAGGSGGAPGGATGGAAGGTAGAAGTSGTASATTA